MLREFFLQALYVTLAPPKLPWGGGDISLSPAYGTLLVPPSQLTFSYLHNLTIKICANFTKSI